MPISQKDIKLLWGRAASRCAICCKQLSHTSEEAGNVLPVGEQAHIVAEEPSGPRGGSVLSLSERNTYHNLILLCPSDHVRIDKDVASYPVERLHLIKSRHELWVEQTLGRALPKSTELIPLSDFMTFIEQVRPLLYWLYRPVPEENALGFFEALQRFWTYHNIAVQHLDKRLIQGVDKLVRPLAAGERVLYEDAHYAHASIFRGSTSIGRYFQEQSLWRVDFDKDDPAPRLILQLAVQLESVLRQPELMDADRAVVQHLLHITKYYENYMHHRGLPQIPESLTVQFSELLQTFMNEQFNVVFPDLFDVSALDRIQNACVGNLFH